MNSTLKTAIKKEVVSILEKEVNTIISNIGIYKPTPQIRKTFEIGIHMAKGRDFHAEGEFHMHEDLEINTPYIFVLISMTDEIQVFHNKELVLDLTPNENTDSDVATEHAQNIVNQIKNYLESCK